MNDENKIDGDWGLGIYSFLFNTLILCFFLKYIIKFLHK
jgi:hypothetical protein